MAFYPRFDKCGEGKYRVIDLLPGNPVPTYTGDVLSVSGGWAYRTHIPGVSAKWNYGPKTRAEAARLILSVHQEVTGA
jgi:hypothetical protein